MDRSGTVQGWKGWKQHPAADNPLMVTDCQGIVQRLFMNAHRQQHLLGPDGQDRPWIVQRQNIALHGQGLSGSGQ